jgi:transcription elongation factor Elf1
MVQQIPKKATRYPRIPKKPKKKAECPRCHQLSGVEQGKDTEVRICLKCGNAWKVKL